MNLIPAWRDSLTILQPKNFKLFFLVTLKAMVDTFKVWIKYFWWLLALPIVLVVADLAIQNQIFKFLAMVRNAIPTSIMMVLPSYFDVLVITLLLAARPSVALKDCAYFRSYFWRAILMAFMLRLPELVGEIIFTFYFRELVAIPLLLRVVSLVHLLLKWYAVTYVLFFLDSDGSIKGFFRSWLYAAKMMVFNLPFYTITGVIALLIFQVYIVLLSYLFRMSGAAGMSLGVGIQMFVYFVLMLAFELFKDCFLANFYIKKLHDQFTLYFGKNE